MNLPASKSELHQLEIERDGFTVVDNAINGQQVDQWLEELEHLFATDQAAIKNRAGAVYAARNILASLPGCCDIGKVESLNELLLETLGPDFGLVRGLYFDKHPERTWSLPWHKDLTIAVENNSPSNNLPSNSSPSGNSTSSSSQTSKRFSKPTRKSGVDHVEAPEDVLESMLTLRIHLDDVTTENGPLEVAVGSHANGKSPSDSHDSRLILVNAGDVLAMRPMLSHTSGSSDPNTKMHRRILHLEFAAFEELGDGYQWHQFLRVTS